jgi:hypothetical protein
MRFMPLPVYAYVVVSMGEPFQIIEPFTPFVTYPTHRLAWDALYDRIRSVHQ